MVAFYRKHWTSEDNGKIPLTSQRKKSQPKILYAAKAIFQQEDKIMTYPDQ